MAQFFAVLVMLAILSILIIVHECGHFLVARLFGFQTPVFGFGLPFGPSWTIGHRWGTEFRVHACLLGGYVAIPELGDESNQDAFGTPLKPFRKFPIWQRALVAFAGVGFNMLFAWLVMFVMLFSLGQPNQALGVQKLAPEIPIATNAGVKPGDEILAINGVKVTTSEEAIRYLTSHKASPIELSIMRPVEEGGEKGQPAKKIPMTLKMTSNADGKVGMVLGGVGPTTYTKVEGNFIEILGLAWTKLWTLTFGMLDALGQMFHGLFTGAKGAGGTPAVGIQDLHGVLAVVKIGADIAQQDWSQLFIFTVMISMDLAIINLLPWPALDGGHLAFMAVEAVRGRPMGERAQGEIVKWGFISLIFLMVVIMVNDVSALMTGKLDFKSMKERAKQEASKGTAPGETPAPSKSESSAPGASSSSSPDSGAGP
ncbi:MAG TPA: M50 family metallopeptidase [Candidatus Obscuribacterales bacterium]